MTQSTSELVLDLAGPRLIYGAIEVPLTKKQSQILAEIAGAKGIVRLDRLHEQFFENRDAKGLRVFICRLRKKMEQIYPVHANNPLRNLHGIGYVWQGPQLRIVDEVLENAPSETAFQFDLAARMLTRNGKKTKLTKADVKLVEMFALNADSVTWELARAAELVSMKPATFKTMVSELRRAMAPLFPGEDKNKFPLETLWGKGYRWVGPKPVMMRPETPENS